MSTETTYTIDPSPDGDGVWVHSHGEYPASSVNAGQYRRVKCGHFDDAQAALAMYPQATVNETPALPMWLFR